ncbi:uncharacterized protein LOC125198474, partial [Salvia hispanica]|uniref:uncharacterized protein LOC125198474 n=1 Tax=Salvia hispanica TaxID=49212 RepID=UPI002009A9C6
MFWIYNKRVRFEVGKYSYEPTDFPHFSVKINIFFHSQESNYLISLDSEKPPLRPLPFFSSDITSPICTTVRFITRESLSYNDIQEEVRETICDHIQSDKLSEGRCYDNYIQGDGDEELLGCTPVIEIIWEMVSTMMAEHVELKVDLNIRMIYSYAYIVGKGRHNAMANSGFKLMEFCGGGGGVAETGWCPICLAEIGGAPTLRMPCSHLFHAVCLVLWLRRGYSCPLCHYETPSINQVFDTTRDEPTRMNIAPPRPRSLIKTMIGVT